MHTSRSCGGEIRPVVTIRTACGVNVLCVAGLFPGMRASSTTVTIDVGPCIIVAKAIIVPPIFITAPVSARCVDKGKRRGWGKRRERENGNKRRGRKGKERKNKSTNVERLRTAAILHDAGRICQEHVRSNQKRRKGGGRGERFIYHTRSLSARASFHATQSVQN